MELDHTLIRVLAAIEREGDYLTDDEELHGSSDTNRETSTSEAERMQATLYCGL
jgi:hypothetical protein